MTFSRVSGHADYSYLKNYDNSSAAVSNFLCAFLYWNTWFPLFLDFLSCFLFQEGEPFC